MVEAPPTVACHGATVYDPRVSEPVTHSRNICCFVTFPWHRCHLLSDIYACTGLPLNEELSLSSGYTWGLRGRKTDMKGDRRSKQGLQRGLTYMQAQRDGLKLPVVMIEKSVLDCPEDDNHFFILFHFICSHVCKWYKLIYTETLEKCDGWTLPKNTQRGSIKKEGKDMGTNHFSLLFFPKIEAHQAVDP